MTTTITLTTTSMTQTTKITTMAVTITITTMTVTITITTTAANMLFHESRKCNARRSVNDNNYQVLRTPK